MPVHERRAIFGLMVANEGKTRIPIFENYTQAGFDPDKDMLQANLMPPNGYRFGDWWQARGMGPPQWRMGGGGLVVDWDLKTNLEGLYACAGMGHAGAATAGRYAGRKATEYSAKAKESVVLRKQIEEEKTRVYSPLGQTGDMGWKELYAGICRIMQDYCGEYRGENTLKTGLWWLNSIREGEFERTYIRNPHELTRSLECLTRITVGEMIMHASLARKASCPELGFKRLDFPAIDPPEWNKFVTIRQEKGHVKVGELPFNYWLQSPNAPTYEENYKNHCGL
jgi:succinate dehydrogenase/fumarate reductase flavoprotein subunit